MDHLLHRTANESTYYAPPPRKSLLRTTTNCYCRKPPDPREGQGARKGNGVRGHHLPSPPCFVQNLLIYFGFLSRWERLLANIRSVYSYTWILIYFTFISFIYFIVISNIWFCMLDVINRRHTWNCQIRTHIHTEIHTRTHTPKQKNTQRKKKMWRQSAHHSHSLRWEKKTAPWEFQTKLLHYFFMSNNKSNLHFKREPLRNGDFRKKTCFARRKNRNLALRSGSFFASTQKMHRPRSQSLLHFWYNEHIANSLGKKIS